MNDSIEKFAAGTIFLCSKTKRVLLSLRAPYKTHKLTWSLWGGMMEDGEHPKDCLLREIEEEMGFVPDINKVYPFDVFQSTDKNFMYYTFVCITENEFIPILNSESVGYCWTELGIWPKPMHYGARKSLCGIKSLEKLKLILDQHT